VPVTVAEADARWDWSTWTVPTMPDLPAPPWAGVPGCFWDEDVTARPVDEARTLTLGAVDVPMHASAGAPPYIGVTWGLPYQLVDSTGPTTPVWDQSRPITWNWFTPTFPITHVPLPPVVRRECDPAGGSDLHWYGYDPDKSVLWEAIGLMKPPLARWSTWGQCDWVSGYNGGGSGIMRWDTARPWDAPGQPRGVVAAAIPQFPLIARWDEVAKGRIEHALYSTLPNYSPEKTGPARASDGDWVGHPVRAGERLRLKRSVVDTFPTGSAAHILATAMHEYGVVHSDRCGPRGTRTGVGAFQLSADRRWHTGDGTVGPLGRFELRLTDFDIVT
jgi:hypothetical protein